MHDEALWIWSLTWNICLTFCLGKFTLSLWSSWWTSPMLKVPSPFLSASEKVCCNHVKLQLRLNYTDDDEVRFILNVLYNWPNWFVFLLNNQLTMQWCICIIYKCNIYECQDKGYWSRVRCLRAKLSSSLIPAMRYFSPVIQVRASSALVETKSRDFTRSP